MDLFQIYSVGVSKQGIRHRKAILNICIAYCALGVRTCLYIPETLVIPDGQHEPPRITWSELLMFRFC
jgi:hypothetical protein